MKPIHNQATPMRKFTVNLKLEREDFPIVKHIFRFPKLHCLVCWCADVSQLFSFTARKSFFRELYWLHSKDFLPFFFPSIPSHFAIPIRNIVLVVCFHFAFSVFFFFSYSKWKIIFFSCWPNFDSVFASMAAFCQFNFPSFNSTAINYFSAVDFLL